MNGNGKSVIVIGGGVIGAASAHYLRKAGCAVTILEKNRFGAGCSHGNCGYVCPSHILPMAEPGIIGKTLKAMLSSASPFYIKPRLSVSLWSWLASFTRRCNETDMLAAGKAIEAILESSISLYRELVSVEGIECEWQERGLLYAYRDKARFEAYAPTDRLLTERFHHPAQRYDGDAVLDIEPALKPGLAGGWFYPRDAHLRADRLMASWRKKLDSSGVRIIEGAAMDFIDRAQGRATHVRCNGQSFPADAFVVAAGAWTPLLTRQLGCRIPIQPGKGYSITMARPAVCPAVPMIFPETRVAVTPWQSGYRLGSTMEFAGYDATINRARLALLRHGAQPYLREPYCEPVEEEWFGWRPMTFDSLPIIGATPQMENVFIAAGHSMVGISMATGTGKLVSELVTAATPHIDPNPYSPTRF